ncbi:MAG TPA: hypothetical protein VH599_12510 [Ktedonobacterales bacterium]|jgi:hypothetical protein
MSSTICEHSDELLTLGAMQLLSAEEQTRLETQVSACAACRARFQEYRALAGSMPQLALLETAPSKALNGKQPPSTNSYAPHLPTFFGAGAAGKKPEDTGFSSSEQPIAIGPQRRRANQRLVKVLSSLAAAVILVGLIGGFWLLMLSRASHTHNQTINQPTQQTVIAYNPCSNEIAKGVNGIFPACGLIVMDYSQTPPTLKVINPSTGEPLFGVDPLPVGNALLASLSADRLTLALGIIPNPATDPISIQMVGIDPWKLGAKLPLRIASTESLQSLAITSNGTGVYAVIEDYLQTPIQAILQYYTYARGTDTLKLGWSEPLPFVPGNGLIGDGSFALSADGKTAYLFSAATNPPQLAAVPLQANGTGSPHILQLPSIATGAEPPLGDEHYTYRPGDTIYQWYRPAVIFAPQQNKLYLVHAQAADPNKDMLLVIDLAQMKASPDIPIHDAGQALPALSLPAQSGAALAAFSALFSPQIAPAMGSNPLTLQPQIGVQPYKGWKPYNGRKEVGAVSPDGRWIYLSGSSSSPQFNSDGSWSRSEQETGLGVLKIDTQTGQVVGRWLKGSFYDGLTLGGDGRNLYLNAINALLVFDTQQQELTQAFLNIQSTWFILALP